MIEKLPIIEKGIKIGKFIEKRKVYLCVKCGVDLFYEIDDIDNTLFFLIESIC